MLKPASDSSSLSAESHTCAFCPKPSNYSCPKCRSLYCSLACYKGEKHVFCSEKFYQANVEQEHEFQNSNRMNPAKVADRKKVLEIVDRFGQEKDGWKYEVPGGVDTAKIRQELGSIPSEPEKEGEWTKEEEDELNELLDKVSEDDLWKMLSPEDQQRFLQFAKMSGCEG
ncbi:hypothetical protein CKK34_0438 [Yarrowia sp. E02]|nr:hypothetical protein CKK34_0438 [Yarrowia sp. E02]